MSAPIAIIGVIVLVLVVGGMVLLTRQGASRVRRSYAEDDDPQGAELSPAPAEDRSRPDQPAGLRTSRAEATSPASAIAVTARNATA